MAALDKRFTFNPHTKIFSDEVNTNFDEIVAFLNNQVAHVDGSKQFTGIPVLPGIDPSLANQATRKSYVDAKVSAVNPIVNGGMAGASPLVGGFPTEQPKLKYGRNSGTTNGNGDLTINWSGGFPHGVLGFTANPMPISGFNHLVANVAIQFIDQANVLVRVSNSTNGSSMANTPVNISWIAVGW